ncbi:GntR family transcriptional regulator [Streptomyces sirii]|uniref:GntR family transcriptional regulator n=1 Tax=Streptomyces sirii TaxID=3127701 RepID=UPI003D3695DA
MTTAVRAKARVAGAGREPAERGGAGAHARVVGAVPQPDLLPAVDRTSGRPLRAQLEHGLRDAIRTGRLEVGERLPSSRELARALGLSRGLAQECYAQLLAEGYLVTRPGSATRVAAGATATVTPRASASPCVPLRTPACRRWRSRPPAHPQPLPRRPPRPACRRSPCRSTSTASTRL